VLAGGAGCAAVGLASTVGVSGTEARLVAGAFNLLSAQSWGGGALFPWQAAVGWVLLGIAALLGFVSAMYHSVFQQLHTTAFVSVRMRKEAFLRRARDMAEGGRKHRAVSLRAKAVAAVRRVLPEEVAWMILPWLMLDPSGESHGLPPEEPVSGDADLVVTRPVFAQRLGNVLFQYVHARLHALKIGSAFESPPLPSPFQGVATHVEASGTVCAALETVPDHHMFPMDASLWRTLPGGGCDLVRSWLGGSFEKLSREAGTVAIHVRLGDILLGHNPAYRPLPMSFYWVALRAIEQARSGLLQVCLVTSPADATHPIFLRMLSLIREWGYATEVQSSSLADDMARMASAEWLILSVSTFSWWAAFLGTCKVVYPRFGLFRPCKADWGDYAIDLEHWEGSSGPWKGYASKGDPLEAHGRVLSVDLHHLGPWEGGLPASLATLWDIPPGWPSPSRAGDAELTFDEAAQFLRKSSANPDGMGRTLLGD
jgi:hypothetical protein